MGLLAPALLGLALAQVPLPGTSSVSVPFSPPSACVRCHGGFDPAASPVDTWSGSAMAHAARDPIFLAALGVAETDAPGVGDLCLRCHAPSAWLEGRCMPTDGSALSGEDFGVNCAFCHRLVEGPYRQNGQYLVADDSVMRGPFDLVTPHASAQSSFHRQAELCGTCHNLINPLVLRKTLTATPTRMSFPEQTTYFEWAQSDFRAEGTTCQSCHMEPSNGPIVLDGPSRDRRAHGFAGGNVYLLDLIEFLDPGLGIADELAAGKARIHGVLQSAATLEIESTEIGRGRDFELLIRVINETGHKLPTGYPEGRRVFVSALSAELGLDRGGYDPSTDDIRDPIAVYEVVQGRSDLGPEGARIHLAQNDTIFFDNRIPPRGFVPTATTAPVGYSYPEVAPGVLAHFDERKLTLTMPCDLDTVTIEVSLFHQSMTRHYLSALDAATSSISLGDRLRAGMAAVLPGPNLIRRETVLLTATAEPDPSCDPGVDAGFADAAVRPDAGAPPADAGGAAPDASDVPKEEEGCGCHVASGTSRRAPWGLGLVLGVLLLRRRRKA